MRHYHTWFYIDKNGLYAFILPNYNKSAQSYSSLTTSLEATIEQRSLIDCLIVFSSNLMAQHLCKINFWKEQEKRISINALEIGLLHHELPVVEKSLESLEGGLVFKVRLSLISSDLNGTENVFTSVTLCFLFSCSPVTSISIKAGKET